VLGRPGSDLLSHALRRSTIGAEGFHGRVRDGIGWGPFAMTTGLPEHGPAAEDVRGDEVGKRGVRGCCPALLLCMDGLGEARGVPRVWQACRAISKAQLHALLRFHMLPINVVVCHGSRARPGLEGGFPLRCIQRLSRPHLATRLCGWRHNRSTRGASIPVLSY
jgi:hypothetical protein